MRTGEVNHQGGAMQSPTFNSSASYHINLNIPRKTVIGAILLIALVAFEIFNFDTTRYALQDLLGGVTFVGISWAAILAIAFCAIDFAGLARLFTPERGREEPKAVWYLMGAWLLGATMNAIMTWWAVSLTVMNHQTGNEVLSREQLLQIVPVLVAALVWLTRILFIGAFSVAGEHIFDLAGQQAQQNRQRVAEEKRPISPLPHINPDPLPAAPPANQPTSRPQRSPNRPPVPATNPTPVPVRAESRP